VLHERQLAESYDDRMDEVEYYVKKNGYLKRQFDDDLIWRFLQKIVVVNGNRMEIQFRS
jgi:site-specific DNA recombinase